MNRLNFDGPINSLSLGNVSYNFLREIRKKNIDINLFPAGNNADLTAFDKAPIEFKDWIKLTGYKRLKEFSREIPTLKVWHINESERKLGDKQFLYTFYEVDQPTQEEINIVKSQEHVFFSCSEAADIFKQNGCDNVSYVPLGFDEDFHLTNKKYLSDDIIHFGLIGKFERRKNTQAIIRLWLKKFGNNPKYQLTCLVNNVFFSESVMKDAINSCLDNKIYNNINFLPVLKTNSEVNELINAIDIDLSGLSNGEGWNLPSFNASALGKWSIVSNCSSHKDWATPDNSILVEPIGKQPCYDNIFFVEGRPFNQGNYYKLHSDIISDAMDKAVTVAKTINQKGLELQKQFTYEKSLNQILNFIL